MSPPRERRVVVITGASSGIGKATAIEFARHSAKLFLCGRDAPALEQAAAESQSHGAETLTCAADAVKAEAIENARDRAVAAFGRIDVWINCAAVLSFGRFEAMPPETFKRVVETNILGYADGSRAALSQFRAQGNRGMLINVSSMLGVVGEPYVSAYVATKFAIRGLTACLRQEARDFPELHICCVLPPAVDTPIYQKASNLMGKRSRAIFPVYSPQFVARTIVWAVEHPRREVIVGSVGHLISVANRLAPMLLERLVGRLAPRLQFEDRREPATDGNLFLATEPHAINGGWKQYWKAKLLG